MWSSNGRLYQHAGVVTGKTASCTASLCAVPAWQPPYHILPRSQRYCDILDEYLGHITCCVMRIHSTTSSCSHNQPANTSWRPQDGSPSMAPSVKDERNSQRTKACTPQQHSGHFGWAAGSRGPSRTLAASCAPLVRLHNEDAIKAGARWGGACWTASLVGRLPWMGSGPVQTASSRA